MNTEGEWVTCHWCDGSGKDDDDWASRCNACNGRGEIWLVEEEEDVEQEMAE